MTAARRHPHDLYNLPTLAALLAKSRANPDYRGSRLSAVQKQAALSRGGQSPVEWEEQIEAAKAKRDGKGRHNRRGIADLPVATAKDLAEAAPRYCDVCEGELSPDARPDKKRCGKECDDAAKRRRLKARSR